MKGTKKFLSWRILDNGVLPMQDDTHSCGIGLIAAIKIILDSSLAPIMMMVASATLKCSDVIAWKSRFPLT
jgi:hypothetical protein